MGGCLEKIFSRDSGRSGRPEIKLLSNQEDNGVNEINNVRVEKAEKLTALYDYVSRNSGDLSFRREDEFILVSKGDEWLMVESAKTGERGYVPSNYVAATGSLQCEDWFFCKLTRKDSERLLMKPGNAKGSYLIRESETSQTSFSLSLVNDDPDSGVYVKHYRIHCTDGKSFFITEGLEFNDLRKLVEYYKGIFEIYDSLFYDHRVTS